MIEKYELKDKILIFDKNSKISETQQRKLAILGKEILNELEEIFSENISKLNQSMPEGYKLHPIYSWLEDGKPYVGICVINSRKHGKINRKLIDKEKIRLEKKFNELEKAYDIRIGWR